MSKKDRPHPRATSAIDREIGARIRARRLEVDMSQETLGDTIGVTFQQVQKYEKGVNRVSASTLINIAKALEVNAAEFLPALGAAPRDGSSDDPEARSIARIYARLAPDARRVLAKVARSLLSEEDQKK
jgi:transcriptional regulator with XRE-family HTH domain